MNDAPLTDDDLSADLDGAAPPEVAARIAADPVAAARQRALRDAAARVRTTPVPPLDDAQVDRLIANALDEPAAPARPARAPGRATPWLVAAAVIVLVAVGLALVWNGRNSDDPAQFATVGDRIDESADDGSGADASAADDTLLQSQPEAGEAATTTVPPTTLIPETGSATTKAPVADLGTFADADALRAALAQTSLADAVAAPPDGDSSASGFQEPPAEAVQRCAAQLQTTLAIESDPLAVGLAVVGGRDVLVYEWDHASFEDGSPTTLVTAVGRDACDEVTLFER